MKAPAEAASTSASSTTRSATAGRKGEIVYLNATLAEWLGIDLTKFQPGSLSVADVVAGEGLALIQSVQAEPGLKRTETLDLDLRKTNGQSLPVRIVHRVSSMRDGAPGDSRTIVLAREEGSAGDQSASASMRFTRFFNNTPMAIASVDGDGRILRTNAPFLKLFSGVVSRDDIDRGAKLETIVHETDRLRLQSALDEPGTGRATSRRSIRCIRATTAGISVSM